MSLTKEWFEQRDQFIAEQRELGNYTLDTALEALNATPAYFFDLGILTQREFSTNTTNFTELTAIGGLFFVEQCQQIFITPEKLNTLKLALEDWDNFSIDCQLHQSEFTGKLSARNQTHFEFKVDARLFNHRLKFRIEDTRNELALFISGDDSKQLLKVWNDFSQCVGLIENQDKSPTNIDIATDNDAINTLCNPWHPIVQRYFRSQMHQVGFKHNLKILKCEIEQTYSVPNSEWHSLTQTFDLVRPSRLDSIDDPHLGSGHEIEVQQLDPNAINQFGMIDTQALKTAMLKVDNRQRYCLAKPGDILLYKSINKKKVNVAYYSAEHQKEFVCADRFCVLRPTTFGPWNGKRLFLFLKSQTGQTLLEYTFRDFSVNALAQLRLTPRQLNSLEIPNLKPAQALDLDEKYRRLEQLINEKNDIEAQITTLIQSQ
ncbi:hypothetical protein AB4559_06245 [Vibrio sp. 10N.222.51.C8]|uniref:hypothetical protein n=1 Tax=unclassified Vibrio TaxID=2614977 RepID=UPI000C85BB8A|nr:hypothetical protein [Vibrio sp. 10N.261.51.A7]PML74501.1 hypothetical protein BCT71_06015 [Vibrio sp. 10N.261.51.A7]